MNDTLQRTTTDRGAASAEPKPGAKPTATKEDFRMFRENKASLYRALAAKAKTVDARDNLLQMAELADETVSSTREDVVVVDDITHDQGLFLLALSLENGPTLRQKISWTIGPFLKAILSWVAFILGGIWKCIPYLLEGIGYVMLTFGGFYFFYYSCYFGFGVQAFLGAIVYVVLNVIMYVNIDDHDDTKKRRVRLLITSVISAALIWNFTFRNSLTPAVDTNEWCEEQVGLVLDTKTSTLTSIVYPGGSRLANEEHPGRFFMNAPSLTRDRLEWFSLDPWEFTIALDLGPNNAMTIKNTLVRKLKATKGQVLLGQLPSELYVEKPRITDALPAIYKEAMKTGKFDHAACAQMIKEKLSTELVEVAVAETGFVLSQQQSFKLGVPKTQ